MDTFSDVIIVGSGASAVHAAYPIVKAGNTVMMLDVGLQENFAYESLIPNASFTEVRRTDPEQHRFFLGNNFEGINFGPICTTSQITAPRQYVLRHADEITPLFSPNFKPAESLAVGGLCGTWGAVCYPYSDNELKRALPSNTSMRVQYDIIAKRIGVSGFPDGLEAFFGQLDGTQPSLEIDSNAEMILSRYYNKRDRFNRAGIYMGRPYMAVLTKPFKGRAPNPYHNMEFWSNKGGSIYRPKFTLDELKQHSNFRYEPSYLVESFNEEGNNFVEILAKSLKEDRYSTFKAKRLILSAGALGTARIVLRSLNQYDVPTPFICNNHFYIPCINYQGLGKSRKDRVHSLAQLLIVFDPTGDGRDLIMSQVYSYSSLLNFKLLKESILPSRESLRIMKTLSKLLVIFSVQLADESSPEKYCVLRRNANQGGDCLEIVYNPSSETLQRPKGFKKKLLKYIRKLGCWPIRTVQPGYGASIHYAGQFPMTVSDKPLTTEPSGKLRGTRSVYIANGAILAYLPAKGLTFTLMAIADRIGKNVIKSL